MATYPFACPGGHITEIVQAMSAPTPSTVDCDHCEARAQRVFTPPAAVHFRGPGFYSTDVKGRVERRRRPNAGDSLHNRGDADTHRLAQGL